MSSFPDSFNPNINNSDNTDVHFIDVLMENGVEDLIEFLKELTPFEFDLQFDSATNIVTLCCNTKNELELILNSLDFEYPPSTNNSD